MRIGIIGAGHIGGTLARRFVDVGNDVTLANSRGPETLRDTVEQLGPHARAGTIADVANDQDVVVISIPLTRVHELPAEAFGGTIVVDTNNYYSTPGTEIAELDDGSTTSSEFLARYLQGARVVKAFNTLYYERLRDDGRPAGDPERLAIPIAGDDADAKRTVSGLVDAIGFDPVDGGPLANGRHQEPGTAIYGATLAKDAAARALAS
ncbi:MAG: oxidoreductase [Actinomycetia bacterium]|nr:oxidoreductase [Actinomycetes bacterium]